MKTAERILDAARQLFNVEGENNVTASDIAAELDMSVGNLYYHFKGKDSIHLALFTRMQKDLVALLAAPLTEPTLFSDNSEDSPLQRCWLFLTVVLEKMLEYRYLYENPNDMMKRYVEIDRGFRRLVKLKRAACTAISEELLAETLNRKERRESLVNAMSLTLTYWLSYDNLIEQNRSETLAVHRGVLQLLSFCAPYLGEEQQDFYGECESLYASMIAETHL